MSIWIFFEPDGKTVYTARTNGPVEAWSLEAGADKPAAGPPVRTFTGHQGSPFCLAAAARAPVLVTGAADDSVRVWDPADGRQLFRGTGHQGYVHAVAVTPDGKFAASGGSDGVEARSRARRHRGQRTKAARIGDRRHPRHPDVHPARSAGIWRERHQRIDPEPGSPGRQQPRAQ